jgi:hypothetical protein
VLPSWRDELRIALSPDRVVLARVSRRWRPRVIAKQTVPSSGLATSDWHSCVDTLRQVLQEPTWQHADARIVLSNHFVRYALVPWSERLVSEDEKQSWVRHHFAERYGETAVPADYRWSEDRPDAQCVASAIDSELISEISAACGPASQRLRSIQPYLMAVFNHCRRHIKRVPAWIVIAESGRVCVASISNGQWRTITSAAVGEDWQAELALIAERRLLLAEEEAPAVVFAYGADVTDLGLGHVDDVRLKVLAPRRLRGYSPQSDAEYGMALTGMV